MNRFNLSEWAIGHRRPITAAAILLTVGLGAAAVRLRIDPTLDRLRSTTDAARLEERIGPLFGLPRDVFVVLSDGADLEGLARAGERHKSGAVCRTTLGSRAVTKLSGNDDL